MCDAYARSTALAKSNYNAQLSAMDQVIPGMQRALSHVKKAAGAHSRELFSRRAGDSAQRIRTGRRFPAEASEARSARL